MLAQVPKGILNSDFIKRVSEEYDDSHFGKKPTSSRGTSTPKTVGTIGCVIEKLLQERPKRTLTGWSLFA
jgi:hypothetical protein